MSRPRVSAAEAVAIVAASLDADDARDVGPAVRVGTYWAVELSVDGLVPVGGQVATVDIATGELIYRDELDVGMGRTFP